jgi:RHS repeat-associated protein
MSAPARSSTARRLRDGNSIDFTFDNLNRATTKNLPGSEPDVTYAYDNLGRLTAASQTGHSLAFTYDALGRNLTQAGPQGTVASQWDLAGRRTRLTYPGSGLYVDYDYLVTGDMTKIRENGAASGIGVLATFGYDDLGQRTSLTFGNGASTSYSYDAVSRLTALTNDLAGTGNDLTIGSMSYNPASQIISQVRSNDSFAWTGHGSGSTTGVANGLNQLTSIGGGATAHDARGNLTSDPTTGKTYGYSSENLLTSASGGVSLAYDPSMRLYQFAGASTTRFAYDGVDMIAEHNGSDTLQRRFVHGPGLDEPLVQYEGTGTADRRFLHADERGSIIASSDGSGAMLAINKYDEFGKPQTTNAGRFQYTGQMWIGEIGGYHYKARVYFSHLGRFGQTDPRQYGDGMNMYAYVGNDPVNFGDPSGMTACTGSRIAQACMNTNGQGHIAGGLMGHSTLGYRMQTPTFVAASWEEVGSTLQAWQQKTGAFIPRSSFEKIAGAVDFGGDLAGQMGARGYWDTTRSSKDGTYEALNAMFKSDLDTRTVIKVTLLLSFTYKQEFGVWISQKGSDYYASSRIFPGSGPIIFPMPERPRNAGIFFHAHPFTNLPQGLSDLDVGLAGRNSFMIVSLSRRNVLDWADFRN